MSTGSLEYPSINSPYVEPTRHFVVGDNGPTGEISNIRRPSQSFIPVPKTKKVGKHSPAFVSEELDLFSTGEKVVENDAIDQLRDEVRHWRNTGYDRVTSVSRRLLAHWSDPNRDNRILFAQREAAETAIFLSEVVGRSGYQPSRLGGIDWREVLQNANDTHNAGLPRVALKLATGAGKTIVMAMLIAWQTLNKDANPHDSRFVNRFLIITPGITIRDRLKVLQPDEPENYFDLRGLVPVDLRRKLNSAQVEIVNYHQFLPRDSREIKGVAANTRKLLLAGKALPDDPFKETPQAVVSRLMRSLGGANRGEIIVFNDEAHHCYRKNEVLRPNADLVTKADADIREEVRDATVWFEGIQWIQRYAGLKTVFDLSATPFYLKGSGWSEGLIFPWVVSDFSLMDAIESGIVKVPRLPTDDDSRDSSVTYLHLYDKIKDDPAWPKTAKAAPAESGQWIMPAALEGALRSLYKSYERSFADWEKRLRDRGEPPPVMIVVAPNTWTSRLIYDWIAGHEVKTDSGSIVHAPGELALFSNVVDGKPLSRPRSIIVNSKELESDEAMKDDFKKVAADEIEAFKRAYREANPGANVEDITDKDLLREVMNTVGKKGKLGEQVRCVVSVSMLTEGWDANTVTHILGVRAFGSQLLCEQVVGRGLRRRDYAPTTDPEHEYEHFVPEYSNVYGIPFAFIPGDGSAPTPRPAEPATHVQAMADRVSLRIEFPFVSGYRIELPDAPLEFDVDSADRMTIDGSTLPSWVNNEGIVGENERIDGISEIREQELAFRIAKRVMKTFFDTQGDRRPWLFPQIVGFTKEWLRERVHVTHGFSLGYLSLDELQQQAAETVYNAITRLESHDARRPRLRPILRGGDPSGSTDSVSFDTRKATIETKYSHVSHVTLDGKGGNEWEKAVAIVCENLAAEGLISSYVKNDQLGFVIPYVHKGRTHEYWPDFLVRLPAQAGESFARTLIVEVSGSQKSPGPTKEKARTARDSWCVAVNNHGGFGRWGYIELGKHGVADADWVLREAIRGLIADEPIIGDPDLLYTGLLLSLPGAHAAQTKA